MKPVLVLISIFLWNLTVGQPMPFKMAKHWKLYDITSGNLFQYSIDTLKNFAYYDLDDDTMRGYISEVSALPSDDPPRWMGAHIATYELDGAIKKVEVSLYGGFFYDESSRKHYQLPDNKIDDWLSYIRRSFMTVHKGLSGG